MVKIKHIRPIPKYIVKKIQEIDATNTPSGHTRFYKYYTTYNKDLCEVIVAVRNYYKKWYCKQVVVHAIHNEECFLRDIGQTMGFTKVGWFREGISKYQNWNDYDWDYNDDKYFNLTSATIVNKEFISTLPEYKYSAIDLYDYTDTLKYLRFYEKYPQCELLVKAGLSHLVTSKMILKLCNKDKKFCHWLYAHKDILHDSNAIYKSSIIRAYKQNKPVLGVYKIDRFKLEFGRENNFKALKNYLKKNEREKFLKYLVKQSVSGFDYLDYLNACQFLGLNMNDAKHRYPNNFKKWHDIRIEQYSDLKAKLDEEARKELYEKFKKVAQKYQDLERLFLKDDYVCLIAKSPQQLVYEGQELKHCVGRMNYDQKFAREESLIFFIRNRLAPNTPFVTLEYSLKSHKVLQCYAQHNTQPADDVLEFVNKKWLPYANRKIKKIAS